MSVIERGLKVTKLDTFVAIANALDVSADTLFDLMLWHIQLQVLPMSWQRKIEKTSDQRAEKKLSK